MKASRGLLVAVLLAAGLILSSAPANAATCTSYQYGRGGYGTCVRHIQTILNGITAQYNWRIYYGTCRAGEYVTDNYLAEDASFGPATTAKVKSVQGWSCKNKDGVVGPKTWEVLCTYGGSEWFGDRAEGSRQKRAWYAARSAGCRVY